MSTRMSKYGIRSIQVSPVLFSFPPAVHPSICTPFQSMIVYYTQLRVKINKDFFLFLALSIEKLDQIIAVSFVSAQCSGEFCWTLQPSLTLFCDFKPVLLSFAWSWSWWSVCWIHIKDLPNGLTSGRKLRTWVYLRLCLARPCVHLPWLVLTCAYFGQDQICTQVKASFSPFGHPTQVNASDVP